MVTLDKVHTSDFNFEPKDNLNLKQLKKAHQRV